MFDIGGGELMLILIAVLIFFGPKKLPELAQSLGRGLREFKRAQREFTDHINQAIEQEHQRSTGTVARGASSLYEPPVIESPVIESPPPAQTIAPPMQQPDAEVSRVADPAPDSHAADARAADGHAAEPHGKV